MPLVDGRGAGLGNEMIVWAKAFIAAQTLGLRVEHPAWGLNRRGYRTLFGTSRADWIWHRALRASLPFFRFDDAERVSRGGAFEPALLDFAAERGLPRRTPFVLGVHGMGGGYAQLAPAREFLRGQLLSTRGTQGNLYRIEQRLGDDRLRIGLHVRRGDFGAVCGGEDYRARFNVALPLDWYVAVAKGLARALGDRARFLVVSDATEAELRPLTRAVPCVLTADLPNRDVSDMLALAGCDLLVCSISSFSLWAVFLSQARYAWFAPNLTVHGEFGSIWGHEAEQRQTGSATCQAFEVATTMDDAPTSRGVAIGEDGTIPAELVADLKRRAGFKRPEFDLLRYGVATLPTGG